MSQYDNGNVHVDLADGVTLDPRAGKLDAHQVNQLEKAHANADAVGLTTSQALKSHPSVVAPGVTPDELAQKATNSKELGNTVAEIEAALRIFKQQQLLLDADLHESLRRVLAAVHAEAKFDAKLTDAFADLLQYFAQDHHKKAQTAPTGA